jgi:hypothetical protein
VGDPLTPHHALAVVRVPARAQVGIEHRGLRLLGLEDEWILAVAADEEADGRARADAPHADDLARRVDEPVRLEQVAPVLSRPSA